MGSKISDTVAGSDGFFVAVKVHRVLGPADVPPARFFGARRVGRIHRSILAYGVNEFAE